MILANPDPEILDELSLLYLPDGSIILTGGLRAPIAS